MTHSLVFAAALSIVVVSWLFRADAPFRSRLWWQFVAFFFVVTTSHGFIDAFTNGGLGIAFFAPFNPTRYFMPWQPLVVPAIGGLETIFSPDGFAVMLSELIWVWIPVGIVTGLGLGMRAAYRRFRD